MIHLKKERLPKEKYNKLMMKKIGPFKILKKCGNNTYQIDLPFDIGLSPIFKVYLLSLMLVMQVLLIHPPLI